MRQHKSPIGFIGPLAPPIGGVAFMNQNIQRLLADSYHIEFFNTSRGRLREDMYGGKKVGDVYAQVKIILRGIFFIYHTKAKIINIFVTSNTSFFRELVFLLVASILQKKIVVHLHSKIKGELFLKKYLINFFGFILRVADKVLVLSELHRTHFSKYINESKLEVLENFVYEEKYESRSRRNDLNFLYVGRATKEKGIYDLINAVSLVKNEIPKLEIHVIGVAETEQSETNLRAAVKSKGLEEIFVFHGALSGDAKYQLFHQCGVLVFPSHFENSPVVLKEALAAKQLIVCSDILANKNVLKNILQKFVYYFPVADYKKLSEAILLVCGEYKFISKDVEEINCPVDYTSKHAQKKLLEMCVELSVSSNK